jgi:hypothetical protein
MLSAAGVHPARTMAPVSDPEELYGNTADARAQL